NPKGDRYRVELDINSVQMDIGLSGAAPALPLIEIMKTTVVDRETNERMDGMVGNNFSSYVREYDYSVLLQGHNKDL
ncbi:putative oxygenase MesX, partial [Pseudomonas sp. BJa3]|uniref:putative oxygenase MesX n=1 Tax=Pseudomonas sp. BJa3 TaxID=2986525 RepID=UPI002265DB39